MTGPDEVLYIFNIVYFNLSISCCPGFSVIIVNLFEKLITVFTFILSPAVVQNI